MYFGQEFVIGLVFPKVQRIKAGSGIIVRIFFFGLELLVINQSEIEFSAVATLG